jgi:hypothetical protein
MTNDLWSVLIVFTATLLACALLWIIGKKRPRTLNMDQKNLLATNFGFFTTLYTFFLGFAVVTLWGNYNDADSNVTKEAQRLLIAYHLSAMLPNGEGLRNAVRDYTAFVIDKEWDQMRQGVRVSEQPPVYERLWDEAHGMKPVSLNDTPYHVLLIERMIDISTCRHSRLDQVDGNLYAPIWMLIYIGLVFSVLSFHFVNLEHNAADMYFVCAVISMILCNIFLIYELNTPFSGWLRLEPDQFVNALARMKGIG